MEQITFSDFQKLAMRIGTITTAERVPDADKLLKLTVDVGEEKPRQILAGIAEFVEPETLVGKQCPFVVNLEPKKLRGLMSEGMILAAGDGDGFTLLHPGRELPPGSVVR